MVGSSFTHLIRTDSNALFLIAKKYSTVYMYHSFLIHSSTNGHLGCFHVLAIINSAEMNIGVHVSLSDLVSSVCMPSSRIAGSYGSSISRFLRNLYTVLIVAILEAYLFTAESWKGHPITSAVRHLVCPHGERTS